MRKNEERARQLQTVKVDAVKIRRALSEQGIPLTKVSREMGYASDYLASRLKEDGTVPVVVAQLLKYKYGIDSEPAEEAERTEEQIPGQLSIEDLERARRIEERVTAAKKYPRNPDPDLTRTINLVKDAIQHDKEPIGANDYLGAAYAERYGYYRHAMKLIAEELGVQP